MPQGRTTIIALAAGLTLVGQAALATSLFPPPAPDGAQTTPVPSAQTLWQRTLDAYRASVFGERVRISITRPRPSRPGPAGAEADRLALEELMSSPGDEQRGVVFLRAAMVPAPPSPHAPTHAPPPAPTNNAPADPTLPERTPVFRLEMGDVRVYGEFGRLLAVRASVPGGVVIRTFDGPVTQAALDRLIPRMLLPTLSMLLAAPAPTCDLTPGLSAPEWSSSSRIREAGKNRLVLRGATRSDRGVHNLTATIDEATSRLVSLRIEPAPGDAETQPLIELFFAPIDPGDPATWIIDPAGRIEVPSLDRLRAAPPTTPTTPTIPTTPTPNPATPGPAPLTTDPIIPPPDRIASAATLPPLHLLNARTESWANERTPAGRFAGLIPEDAAHFRVVLFLNLPAHAADRAGREALTRASTAINAAIARARNVSPDPSVTLSAASVAVLELEGFDDARRRAQDAWQQLDPTAAAPALPLLCSPAGRAMYARFSAKLIPVIVVVDERLAIREMIEIDPRAGIPADLVERLSSMLSTGP